MAERSHDQDSVPRIAFTAALAQLRRRLPDVSDEVLARRASGIALPSGRRIAVNARRIGEWINGRSVPRDFEQVHALVQAVETAAGGSATGQSLQRWRQLWRAAHEQQRAPARTAPAAEPVAELVVGRPPSDAASLRERPELAAAIDGALRDDAVRQVLLTGPGGSGKSQLAAAAFHRARGSGACSPGCRRRRGSRCWPAMPGSGVPSPAVPWTGPPPPGARRTRTATATTRRRRPTCWWRGCARRRSRGWSCSTTPTTRPTWTGCGRSASTGAAS
ncbi:hypothetical protein ACFQZ4_38280 [Catellatospora coxensis]